jgi:hypothetical protein
MASHRQSEIDYEGSEVDDKSLEDADMNYDLEILTELQRMDDEGEYIVGLRRKTMTMDGIRRTESRWKKLEYQTLKKFFAN